MNFDFTVEAVDRVILVGKNEYNEKTTEFSTDLRSNELIFVLSGDCTVTFGNEKAVTHAGTVRFLPQGKNEGRYIVERQNHGECIVVYFKANCKLSDKMECVDFSKNKKMEELFKKVFSVYVAKQSGYKHECLSLLYKIFSEIEKTKYVTGATFERLKPAISHVGEHFMDENLDCNALADLCGMSYTHFKNLFISAYGVSPKHYIIEKKIDYAGDLMLGGVSVGAAAETVGFYDQFHFCKVFKRYRGITPSAFIKKYRSSK